MPISEIGKTKAFAQSGYTLIEILAVLIILSIIGLLAFPRYERGEEKAYLKQIGKLIQADIRTAGEEAVYEKSEVLVGFFINGYRFEIGDMEIRRVFDKFQFRWDLPVEEYDAESEGEFEVLEGSEAGETHELSGGEDEEVSYGSIELFFDSDGVYPDLSVEWSSNNYKGSLIIQSDGSVNWVTGN